MGKHSADTGKHSADNGVKQARKTIKSTAQGRKRPALIALVIIVAVLLVTVGVATYWIVSLNHQLRVDGNEREALSEQLAALSENTDAASSNAFYVLIVGSDAQANHESVRGDALMLCRVSPDTGTVHLVSIPRDTMIDFDGEVDKINTSFARGGAAYAASTVSTFAGVPISHYVEVEFNGLVDVVDLLGGVWVDVPADFEVNGYSFSAGTQLLNGEQALAYARQRTAFEGGDFTRAQSQRQIVEGLIDKIVSAPPAEIPDIISSIAGMVTTDYNVSDLASLAVSLRGKDLKLFSAVCPSYSLWQDNVFYAATMYNEWSDMMKRVDAGLDPSDTSTDIPEPQSSSTVLGSATNSAAPTNYTKLVQDAELTTDDVDIP